MSVACSVSDEVRRWEACSRRVAFRSAPAWQREDACADALVGVWRALRSYDPGRGVPLRHWVSACARSAVLDGLRARGVIPRSGRRLPRRPDLFTDVLAGGHGDTPGLMTDPRSDDACRRVDLADEAEAALARLPDEDALLLRRYYLGGLTLREAAALAGRCEAWASRRLRKIAWQWKGLEGS